MYLWQLTPDLNSSIGDRLCQNEVQLVMRYSHSAGFDQLGYCPNDSYNKKWIDTCNDVYITGFECPVNCKEQKHGQRNTCMLLCMSFISLSETINQHRKYIIIHISSQKSKQVGCLETLSWTLKLNYLKLSWNLQPQSSSLSSQWLLPSCESCSCFEQTAVLIIPAIWLKL